MTVAENIFLGNEERNWWNTGKKELIKRSYKILSSLNFDIDPRKKVNQLNSSQKQLVEIAKALARKSRIIIMDEPTAVLTEHETQLLFNHIKELKEHAISVIFISHRLEEVFRIADQVTVLRDGKRISTGKTHEYTYEKLIKDVVGRSIEDMFPKENRVFDRNVFVVDKLNIPGIVKDISFEVKKGEIFGIAGLVGSGKGEVGLGIYGGIKAYAKKCQLDGENYSLPSRPDRALEKGIVLIPEDRKSQGLVLVLNVMKNVILPNTEMISKYGIINWKESKKVTKNVVSRLNIRTPSIKQKVKNLSGGNQQKVVLGKGLIKEPRLVIFVEPTRGIDIGAKVEVYKLMNELLKREVGIIIISSELPEIVSMSDRVLVLHRGEKRALLQRKDINQHRIAEAAMGG
jgi:ribose transport system ATP-binding protein